MTSLKASRSNFSRLICLERSVKEVEIKFNSFYKKFLCTKNNLQFFIKNGSFLHLMNYQKLIYHLQLEHIQ